MEIILYTLNCPKCKILEKKLDSKEIDYSKNEDTTTIEELGFTAVPVLFVDGKYMMFQEAVSWTNNYAED